MWSSEICILNSLHKIFKTMDWRLTGKIKYITLTVPGLAGWYPAV